MTTKTTKQTTKTASTEQLQKDINSFWSEHYKNRKSYSDNKRILLAQEFINEQQELWGVYAYILADINVYHPAYNKTIFIRKTNIYDILGDFVAYVNDQDIEKYKPYPAYSDEQEIHRQRVRSKHEIHLYDLNDEEEYQPPKTISFDEVETKRVKGPEYEDEFGITRSGSEQVTIEQMEQLIDELQADPFNESLYLRSLFGGDVREIARKIKGLKKENIKICKICKEVFYAKDKRMKVCNLTTKYRQITENGKKLYIATKRSPCWHQQNAEKTRRNKWKTPIKLNI
ncbi:hypothetical protein H9636_18435 [Ureibacillus sp. Re31]|uniref:Uncharacterized protein n=1 Tax=Ureibacillus galli TaxID=2762222 RepID=A0ABR8XHA9_9BACL|nr:hypothetical protein [Ureibacillus galli]MBD8028616.1 hypothetical protein [Ureibacillus galli]